MSNNSMDSFFYTLQNEKKIKDAVQKILTADFPLQEQEILFLELFYTTSLSWEDLLNLKRKDAESILRCEKSTDLSYVTYARLRKHLEKIKSEDVFDSTFRSGSFQKIKNILEEKIEQRFIKELQNIRVLCSQDEYNILPTPLRLNAHPGYTGKGISIGFLDGGFYPHPDILKPNRRVIAYKDLGSPHRPKSDFEKPDEYSWHGMQTCVSAVGNGYLSNGLYKGIAYDSNVALLKVRGEQGFTTEAIVEGIEWCIRKRKRYNLRILNISLGVEGDGSFRESVINHAAEEAVQAGINVVVAAGNEDWVKPTPPANSPSVITVGGLDDRNSLHSEQHGMYHSSFGVTADGILKPEIIAPGIWVAAPTLPGTQFYREAELVWNLSQSTSVEQIQSLIEAYHGNFSFRDELEKILNNDSARVDFLKQKVQEFKLISPHYQHVDGTSFSAPIVCSIIAQMLEANPELSPRAVKDILMVTSRRLDNIPVEKQGCGVVQARAAVELAKKRVLISGYEYPETEDNVVHLKYEDLQRKSVEVLGEFNSWTPGRHVMKKGKDAWEISFKLDEMGTFPYKFLIDEEAWVDDPLNTNKVYDGFGGFNSLIQIYGTESTRKKLISIEKQLDKIESVKRQSKKHKSLLLSLDELMEYECIGKSPTMKKFYERRIKKVIEQLKSRNVEDGIFLYQLYNSGYVIQTPTLKIGIDVVSGRHVWELFWDVDKALFNELTDLLDISFVTHRFADHLDLDVVNRLISRGKLVVVPSGMENLCLNGVIGFERGEKRDLYSLGQDEMSIRVESFGGSYRGANAADLDMRIYKMAIQEKLNILHLGEHDYRKMAGFRGGAFNPVKVKDVHLLITPVPCTDNEQEINSFLGFINQIDPDVIIPSHLAELGQKDREIRGSYQKAYEILDRTGKDYETLVWGDSVKISFMEPEVKKEGKS